MIKTILWELWGFFRSLFSSWDSVTLTSVFLILLLFRKEIGNFINNLSFKNTHKNIKELKDTDVTLFSQEVKKVEVISIPKQRNKIAWLALFISIIGSIGIPLYIQNQLILPLNKSNVIIDNLTIDTEHSSSATTTIGFNIKNIGKSTASSIRFRIYMMFLDEQFWKDDINYPYFDETLIHELNPDSFATPPNVFTLPSQIIKYNIPAILIFNTEYNDLLLGKQSKWEFYLYKVGDTKLHSLLKSYIQEEKIKSHLKLILGSENSYVFDRLFKN